MTWRFWRSSRSRRGWWRWARSGSITTGGLVRGDPEGALRGRDLAGQRHAAAPDHPHEAGVRGHDGDHGPRARPVVLHCFEGGEREVAEAAERDYYVGLAGNVTYKSNPTADFLDRLNPDRLLVETDAPYLSPQPVRGERNEPKHVVHTARFVAERLGMDEEAFGTLTSRNARNVFGLPLEV
ncbi:hypothetical protein GBA65_13795 [Rubrobacter marinus]|uniref:Uncharacterized protein n=1 Tax=Rubrobacter marinus TaxID=2653852 RepID=A0A6G8PYY0_9ACTN|nr:hypothetical protein GBA65_13795 [Rubrobacter marinus]